jgi:hypothetical protein
MIDEERAREILGLDNVKRFDQLSPEDNDYGGYISKSHGYHMGSLVIDTVNEEETLQVVQGMPKLQYLTKHSDELTMPKIYEKLDGCFYYSQRIKLWDGSTKTIKEIVDNQLKVLVPSYNPKNGKIEPKQIIAWSKNKFDGNFLQIKFENSPQIQCTFDHPIYTDNNSKSKAESLEVGDTVKVITYVLSEDIKEVIYGTLLGDSWLEGNKSPGFGSCHGIKQKDYLEYKKSLFGQMKIAERIGRSGYGSDVIHIRVGLNNTKTMNPFKEFQDICYSDGKKYMNQEWLNKLTPISLAFWYMDDGSINTYQNKNYDSYQVSLHTEGFNLSENESIITHLKKEFGLDPVLQKANKRGKELYYIRFSQNNSMKFLKLIAPYIHKSMDYKLPEELKGIKQSLKLSDKYGLINDKIISITEMKKSGAKAIRKSVRYSITVEDNHNYVAGNCLVGNSNIVMFPLLQDDKCIEVLLKTRGTPTVQNKLMERVKLALTDNHIKAVEKEGLSFAYEIYGTQNPHMIQYQEFDIGAGLDLLAVLDQNKSYPALIAEKLAKKYNLPMARELFRVDLCLNDIGYLFTPTSYFLSKYGEWYNNEPIIAPTLWDGYFKFEDIFERINMAYQKEKGGSIIEGAVWHYTNALGENCMLKSKATSIKKSHQNAAKGINAEIIRQTILKMDDDIVDIASQYNFNKEVLIEYIQKHLLEDYPESVVMDKKGINKVNGELAKFFRKPDELPTNLIDLAKEIREKNLEAASPQDLMRIFATEYQDLRSKSKSMFQAFERLLRAEERRKE